MASIRKRQLPSGRVAWLVDFQDTNGHRRARQFVTKRDADAFLVKARSQLAVGAYVHENDAITDRKACELWLQACAVRRLSGRRMEKATYRDYESKVRLHVLDANVGLGSTKLSRLSRRSVLEFRDRMLANGRSDAQTRKILSVLSLLLQKAHDDGAIAHNPAVGVRVINTSRVVSEISAPKKDDVRRLIEEASDTLRPMLLVAALCGLRASECRGIGWGSVDFEGKRLSITRRADAFNELGQPKSPASVRDVPMGPMVANALRLWKLACPPSEHDLVFPTKRGTIQSHSNILKRHFKPLCRQIGVEMRWHDLRHFAVSLWIEQGFSVKEVMSFAGHSTIQMTMDRYGHLFPSPDHQEAMAQVESRLLG